MGFSEARLERLLPRSSVSIAETLPTTETRAERLVVDLLFALLCAFALVKAIQTTADVQWPYDLDEYRDIGMAQAVLDQRYGTDHLYLGESIWYNPMPSLVVAVCSALSGASPPLVVARSGPYLNLLAPIAFFALIACLFDRWSALAASAAFLFAPIGNAPSWTEATYSPWFFSPNLVQAGFYLTLIAVIRAWEKPRLGWFFLVGGLLGITFLGHTAPALILGFVIGVTGICASSVRGNRDLRAFFGSTEFRGLLLIVITAFVVSLPFTFSILFRYHLRIVNQAPGNWFYPLLKLDNLRDFLSVELTWFTAIAALGFLFTLLDRTRPVRKTILLAWLAICVGEIGLNLIRQAVPLRMQVMFVPAHHFVFYLKAIEDVFFGIAVVVSVRFLVPRLRQLITVSSNLTWRAVERIVIAAVLAGFIAIAAPAYSRRFDFTTAREEALGLSRKAYVDAYRWILMNTRPSDLFLSLSGTLT